MYDKWRPLFMNKHYTLLLSFLLFLAPSNTVHAFHEALTYTPVMSDTSKMLVGGAGVTVGAVIFFWLNKIKTSNEYGKKINTFQDACADAAKELGAIAFSPFKALLSCVGIQTKSIKYPSAQSYFNIAVAAISGYLTAKFAFTFTPEYKFITAQADLKQILHNPTAQKLITDQDNLLKNINKTFVEADRPIIEGHSYLVSIRRTLKSAYDRLIGASSIQDTTAQQHLSHMQSIAKNQINKTGKAITHIKADPTWASALKAAQEAADRARKLMLLQQRNNCEKNKAWAMHRQADATAQLAKAQWHAQHHGHTPSFYHAVHPGTPVAYPPRH